MAGFFLKCPSLDLGGGKVLNPQKRGIFWVFQLRPPTESKIGHFKKNPSMDLPYTYISTHMQNLKKNC